MVLVGCARGATRVLAFLALLLLQVVVLRNNGRHGRAPEVCGGVHLRWQLLRLLVLVLVLCDVYVVELKLVNVGELVVRLDLGCCSSLV